MTKKESTITKTLTANEILDLLVKQNELSEKFKEWKIFWLYREIGSESDKLWENFSFMFEHPKYDSAKIKYKVTKYKVDGKKIEFVNNSKITQVHSESGWRNY
ncbi:hypothetical protein J5Y03_08525 [Bacillus sp. RG28]|uniref:Uncharacterized protein n=1 Tax=Gottfriedia endophytica TaxID=2820819 RepID=A0A940NUR4_9BACI|nr:hypothetical protein [Gottfriedia endophytica]MBP0725233.1 hypothetical protein [Gottfriedia endophytica]